MIDGLSNVLHIVVRYGDEGEQYFHEMYQNIGIARAEATRKTNYFKFIGRKYGVVSIDISQATEVTRSYVPSST